MTRVGPPQTGALHDLLRLAGEDVQRRYGLSHWVPPYPLRLFQQSAVERCVYGVGDAQERVLATFTLGDSAPEYRAGVAWA